MITVTVNKAPCRCTCCDRKARESWNVEIITQLKVGDIVRREQLCRECMKELGLKTIAAIAEVFK